MPNFGGTRAAQFRGYPYLLDRPYNSCVTTTTYRKQKKQLLFYCSCDGICKLVLWPVLRVGSNRDNPGLVLLDQDFLRER